MGFWSAQVQLLPGSTGPPVEVGRVQSDVKKIRRWTFSKVNIWYWYCARYIWKQDEWGTSKIFHLVHWWEFLCRVCNRRQSASKACGESCAAGKVLDKSSLVQKQNYMHERVTEQTGNFTTTCLFVHTIYSHTLHNHVPIPKIMGWLRVDKINDDTPLSLYNIYIYMYAIYIYI